jgi:hypothetical protein
VNVVVLVAGLLKQISQASALLRPRNMESIKIRSPEGRRPNQPIGTVRSQSLKSVAVKNKTCLWIPYNRRVQASRPQPISAYVTVAGRA